jgi:hypothetical protein
MLSFDEQCAKKWNQQAIEVPLPFGVGATDRFYRTIGRAAGVSESTVEEVLAPRRAEAAAALEDFRSRVGQKVRGDRGRGPRCAYNIGSVRSFDLRRIALEELGELPLFEELGFESKLIIQGPSDAANRARTGGVLGELGVHGTWDLFPDPGELTKHVARGEFDLFFGADFLADELSRIDLPLIDKNQICTGYTSMRHNLDELERAVFTPFYRRLSADRPVADVPIPVPCNV